MRSQGSFRLRPAFPGTAVVLGEATYEVLSETELPEDGLVVYRMRARSLVSATEVMVLSTLLALELLRGSQRPVALVAVYAGITGLVLGQATWALNYLRLSNLTGGLLLASSAGITKGAGSAAFNFGGGTLGSSSALGWSSSLNMTLTGSGGNATIDTSGGSIGLTGTMGMNVLERTREIGVMRSIGAVDRVVMKTVIIEGVVIGVISWLLGALLCVR